MSSELNARYFVRRPGMDTLEEFQISPLAKPGQSYPLFAALANQRNSFGVTPIAPPRHLPVELRVPGDPFFENALYLTLDEMLAYDWLSPAWHWLRPSIGDSYPLHHFTRHFREMTRYALQQFQSDGAVYMLFFIVD
jgi:hypothetical protein